MSDKLDDAAATALWRLMNHRVEHMGALYQTPDGYGSTPTVSTKESARVGGTLQVPGPVRALFHNHPPVKSRGDLRGASEGEADRFSKDDMVMANRLGVPSYISAGNSLRRFDPSTGRTEDVLAQIPVEEIRKRYLVQGLMK